MSRVISQHRATVARLLLPFGVGWLLPGKKPSPGLQAVTALDAAKSSGLVRTGPMLRPIG